MRYEMCVTCVKYKPTCSFMLDLLPRNSFVYFPIMTDLFTMGRDQDYPKAENNRRHSCDIL